MSRRNLSVTALVALVCLALAVPTLADQRWVELQPGPEGTEAAVDIQTADTGVSIHLEVTGFYSGVLEVEGTDYTTLAVPGCGAKGRVGEPEMPFMGVLVPVANGPTVGRVELIGGAVPAIQDACVLPARAAEPDCGTARPEFVLDGAVYAKDAWLPAERARVANDVVVRGQRFLLVEISPLQVNPARAEVIGYPDLRVEIALEGEVDQAAEAMKLRRAGSFFPTRVEVAGGGSPSGLKANPTGIEYLILCHDDFLAAIAPLAEWKRLKGLTVEIVPMSVVGATSAAVKSYILGRYQSDVDLTYVLLVGDHQQIPSEDLGGMVSDLYYSTVDGSDYFPDLVMGRISVQTATDCANIVDKILTHDRTPDQDAWHGDFLMAALLQDYDDYNCHADRWFFETGIHSMHYARDVIGMGIYTAATSDSLSCNPYYFRSDSYPHRFAGYAGQPVPAADAALITGGAVATQDVSDAINAGVSIVQHRDHGGELGWGDPNWSTSHISGLVNGNRTPVVFSVNCLTGRFNYSSDCFCEAFMKKYPGGSVGVIGATDLSYSGHNDLLVHGAYDSFWDEYDPADGGNIYPHSFRPAEAFDYGKYYMYHWEGDGSITQLEFELFHWFSDPELRVYTQIPVTPTVTPSCPIPVGSTEVTVACDVEGALVAITDGGTLLGRALVAGGTATVPLDPPPDGPRTLDVVVTGHNVKPWQGECLVIVPDGPWLVHRSHLIDDSAFNNDGIINPGERVVIPITVENVGAEVGTTLVGTLSDASDLCTVLDPTATFPDAAVGQLVQSDPDHFAIKADLSAPHGHVIPLTLSWTAAGGYSGDTSFVVSVCKVLQIHDIAVSEISDSSAFVTWTTNTPASSRVAFGIAMPLDQSVESTTLTMTHSLVVEGLDPCTDYLFTVTSASPGCYEATDDNQGAGYAFTTAGRDVSFHDDVESGSDGWTAQAPWAISAESSHSPANSWSDSPGGNYANNIDISLTSPVISLPASSAPELRFFHTYALETGWDYAYLEVTTNGSAWSQLATYNGTAAAWTEEAFDLSPYAGTATFQLRFRLDTDGSQVMDGWHIDDVEISALAGCPFFADGFESGDTSAWSYATP